jgi:two-component system, NtrC family, sensor histidine kinase HydH
MAQASAARYRYLLVVVAVAMSVALGFTLALGYWQAQRASEFVLLGQGDTLLESLVNETRPNGSLASSERLSEVLARHSSAGLRYLAVEDDSGKTLAEAGAPSDATPSIELSPEHLRRVGNRIRVSRPFGPPAEGPGAPPVPPPPLRPEAGLDRPTGWRPANPDSYDERAYNAANDRPGSPDFRPPPPPDGRPPPGGGPPSLVIEFESQLTQEIENGARRTVLVGVVAIVVFIGLCLLLLRLLSHRDELVRRLERERHLSSLGEMSAVLAHEIRNPLASLKGHAQLLTETLVVDSKERTKADRIVQEAIRLEELTSDLLSFVRSGKIEKRDVSPTKILQEAAGLVDDPRITLSPSPPSLRWRLDPDRMQQVLTNVLSNAVQASVGDTPVEASVRHERRTLIFTVRDHGAGVGEGDAERIFEPFFTRKTRGTGLGMPIARRIVEAHGGKITATNHPQGGAVFEICLPEA